jgi:hypothetical protein
VVVIGTFSIRRIHNQWTWLNQTIIAFVKFDF